MFGSVIGKPMKSGSPSSGIIDGLLSDTVDGRRVAVPTPGHRLTTRLLLVLVLAPQMARTKQVSKKGSAIARSSFKRIVAGTNQQAEAAKAAAPKRRHRFRLGTTALREIRKYQKPTDLLILSKFYQNIPNGLELLTFFTNRPGTKSSQTVR